MTTNEASKSISSGKFPVHLVWSGAQLILDAIRELFANRRALRQQVADLERINDIQAQQLLAHQSRIEALEAK